MIPRRFAFVLGAIYLILGGSGFFPSMIGMPTTSTPPVGVTVLHGYLFGTFAVNILLTLIHLAIGVWGLSAARSLPLSAAFLRFIAIILAAFTLIGLIPAWHTLRGLMPLYGHDVWLHGLTAIGAAYAGFHKKSIRGHTSSGQAHL